MTLGNFKLKYPNEMMSRFRDISKLTGLNCVCPLVLTLSATTLTSQNKVNLSSGKSPLASSIKKSRRINFLNPQSFPKVNKHF
jgi:hypothetical protein